MPATRVRIRKRRLHRVPRGRGRYRTAVADTICAAMPNSGTRTNTGCTDANSCCATCSRACSASAANSCSATCSGAASASAPSAAPSAASAAASAASEQRAGRCDQQCRYGGYCNKLGYTHHDALLFVF
jgi:hypothetical protein